MSDTETMDVPGVGQCGCLDVPTMSLADRLGTHALLHTVQFIDSRVRNSDRQPKKGEMGILCIVKLHVAQSS